MGGGFKNGHFGAYILYGWPPISLGFDHSLNESAINGICGGKLFLLSNYVQVLFK